MPNLGSQIERGQALANKSHPRTASNWWGNAFPHRGRFKHACHVRWVLWVLVAGVFAPRIWETKQQKARLSRRTSPLTTDAPTRRASVACALSPSDLREAPARPPD